MRKPDISAVMTCHSEGVLVGPSLKSFFQAIQHARHHGLIVEPIIVLDRPTEATERQFSRTIEDASIIRTNEGDPGQARNAAVKVASGEYVSFLDGDDLWSDNWLYEAHRFCASNPTNIIAHSEFNVVFGMVRAIWWHIDSTDSSFKLDHLRFGNCWDAMSFAKRDIYRNYPFKKNQISTGFGHEDWHWNCVTLDAGIQHRPVEGTIHFKRRRKGSQMALCDANQAMVWPNPISSYS